MSLNRQSIFLRYGGAVVITAIAIGGRLLLDPWLGTAFPFATMILAIMLSAWLGGFGPAMASVVLGAVVAQYLLLAPRNSFALHKTEWFEFFFYLATGLGIGLLGGLMDAEKKRVKAAAQALRELNNQLETRVRERTAELEQSRNLIQQSGALLAAIVHFSNDAIIGKDLHGIITSWNAGAEKIFGYTAREMLGTSMMRLIPDDRQNDEDFILDRIQRGESLEHFETLRRTKEGRLIDVSITASPIKDTSGQIVGVSKIARDITGRKQTEAAQKEREQELQLIANHIPGPVSRVDRNLRYRFVNNHYEKLFGRASEAVIGRTVPEVLGAELFQRLAPYTQRALAGETVAFEHDVRTASGETRSLLVTLVPDVDPERQVAGYFVIGFDIGERKRMELALRESEASFRGVFEQAAVGVAIVSLEGRFERVNQRLADITGRTRDQLLACAFQEITHPDDLNADLAHVRRLLAGEARTYSMEKRYLQPDGTVVWIHLTVSVLRDGAGEPRHFVSVVQDIRERRQIEQALRDSEERFRTMANSIPQLAWIGRADGFIFWYNQRWYDYTGSTLEEMQGLGWHRIHDPEVLPKVMEQWTGAIAAGKPFEMEFPLRGADGRFRRFLTRAEPLRDAAGKVVQWFGTNTDVDELRRAEAALRESEARFRALFEQSPVGIAQGQVDSNEFTRVNQRYCEIVGYSRAELTRLNFTQFTHPDDLRKDLENLRRMVAGDIRHYTVEKRFIRKDGTMVWVSLTVVPLWEPGEKPNFHMAVVEDITERKQATEALQVSQALYHSLVEQMPAGVFRKDAAGRYVFVNPAFCRLKGTTPEQFLGRTALELGLADAALAANGATHHAQIMQNGRPIEVAEKLTRADGQELYFQVVKSPVFGSDGKVIGSQGMLFDVTARQRAEDEVRRLNAELEQRVNERTSQLEAANQELEAFSYSVSHDLRAPLRTMDGFSRIVLEDYGPLLPEEGRRFLNTICHGAQQMGVLIDDLLAFSRLSRQPMNRREVHLTEQARSTFAELKSQVPDRPIEFKLADLPPCSGDSPLLKQVWVNLLSNALKYTSRRERTVIEVGCARSQGEVVYFVRDNGAGFDMKYAGKLFGVFQRLHRAEEFEGTGVGLAMVQRVINRHGGRIWAEAAENQGATFYFTLSGEPKHE